MLATTVTDTRLKERVRLLAYFMFVTSIVALASSLATYRVDFDQQRFWSIVLCGLNILASIGLYVLAPTPYARAGVYIILLVAICSLAAIDPLSGNLGGGTWVLFQICPPVAALVLRQPRATLLMAGISVTALLLAAVLQFSGVLPVQLTASRSSLYFNVTMQVVVLVMLAAIIALITRYEQRAFEQTLHAQQAADTQLQRVNELLAEQQRLNGELAHSIAATRERDTQLAHEHHQQQELRRTVAALSAPVVPILPGVVVVPLVGSFDTLRLVDFSSVLLGGIEQHRARMVVLDVTGVQNMDMTIAEVLLSAAASCRLLGAQVLVVGVSPEGAQSLVSLGTDLAALHPMADLQQAVQYALHRLASA